MKSLTARSTRTNCLHASTSSRLEQSPQSIEKRGRVNARRQRRDQLRGDAGIEPPFRQKQYKLQKPIKTDKAAFRPNSEVHKRHESFTTNNNFDCIGYLREVVDKRNFVVMRQMR